MERREFGFIVRIATLINDKREAAVAKAMNATGSSDPERRDALTLAISRMEGEGAALPGPIYPTRDAYFQEGLDRIQGIREAEVPYPAGYDLDIANQGRVEDGSNPTTHPLRKGGWVRPNVISLEAQD